VAININKDAHSTPRTRFIEDLISSLNARFPVDQLNILHSFYLLLNPVTYPGDNEIREHGMDQSLLL
jgi:hypothetical protein